MLLQISNKIRIVGAPNEIRESIIDELRFPNPKYESAISLGYSTWGIKPELFNFSILPDSSILVPRGVRYWLLQIANDFGIRYEIEDTRTLFGHNTSIDGTNIVYRPYQKEGVLKLITSSEEGILKAPAGSGKTVMGLSLIPLLGQPTLWLTHTKRLASQAKERAEVFLPGIGEIGLIGKGTFKIGDVLTIGIVQTLIRDIERLRQLRNKFGLVVLDECHHCPAETFKIVVASLNPYYLYGLTATPYRGDKLEKMMFQVMGPITSDIALDEIIKNGGIMLPKVKYKTIRSKTVEGNDIKKIVSMLIFDNVRNKMIVNDILTEAAQNNICIVLCERKAHCEELFKLLIQEWDKVGIATGDKTDKYTNEQIKKLENKEITVLVTTTKLLGEGFDVNTINRAFLASPFRSKQMLEQLVGRAQRTAEGKYDSIIYDYVDVDIPVVASQFYSKHKSENRYNSYIELGLDVQLR